jgi:hypothetical protein
VTDTAEAPPENTLLRVFQRTTAAFAVTVVGFVPLLVALDARVLQRNEVPLAPVAAALAVVGALSLVGGRRWVPQLRPETTDVGELLVRYRSRHFAQLAWAELPLLAGFGAVLLLGGDAWVFGIGAVASAAGFALAWPTDRTVQRDEEALRAAGSRIELAETVRTVTIGDPGGPPRQV